MTDGVLPALPDNHRVFGVVHDPFPVDDGVPVVEDLATPITRHVCHVDDGDPLCGADADPDAPVYPFTGLRSGIRRGLRRESTCGACVDELAALATDTDGETVPADA